MVVFIDESQDPHLFVLAAVVADDVVALNTTIGRFRTISRRASIPVREYHEADLHRDQPQLLTKLLKEMTVIKRKKRREMPRWDLTIVATYYLKSSTEQQYGTALPHTRLLVVYRELFRALMEALPLKPGESLDVVCDDFTGSDKLSLCVSNILINRTGAVSSSVRFADSTREKPLQLADLVAGTIRRHLNGDANAGRFQFLTPLLRHIGVVSVKK